MTSTHSMTRASAWVTLTLSMWVLIAGAAMTQTNISGSIWDGNGGPLNGLYVAVGPISVPAGQTLTAAAGTIVKFQSGVWFNIDGTFRANGTAGAPVIFTAYADDSAGGDTNNNGPSGGSPGMWRGLTFGPTSDASSLSFSEVRYGGAYGTAGISLDQADVQLWSCTVRDCFVDALNLNGNSYPTVANCVFTNNVSIAVNNARLSAVPKFTNNTASGGGGTYFRVSEATVSSNLTLTPASMINGALMIDAFLTVSPGVKFSIKPGVIFKFMAAYAATVDGVMLAQGTSDAPVIFTDDADDSAGGDTNNNGASAGVPAAWRGLTFTQDSDGSALASVEVRYGGAYGHSGIALSGADVTLSACTIRNCFGDALNLNGSSAPTVTDCVFLNNGGASVNNVRLTDVPGFRYNTGSGNGGTYLRITNGAVGWDLAITTGGMLNGGYMMASDIAVAAGATLTLQPGVIFKFMASYSVTVDGALHALGTTGSPVIFTDDGDDSAGGDTDNNGPSSGVTASWRGLVFNPASGASTLASTEVRYGGAYGVSAISLNSADITLSSCTIRNCFADALNLTGSSRPTATNCSFLNNGGIAINNVRLTDVDALSNNTASGGGGTYVRVTNGTVAANLAINPASMINGALMMESDIVVSPGATLTVSAGVVFKFIAAYAGYINGVMIAQGIPGSPVILTDDADDGAGGDTNNNGASAGVAGSWRGLAFGPTSSASTLTNLETRYAGAYSIPGIDLSGADIAMTACTIRNCFADAMFLNANSKPTVKNCSFLGNNGKAVNYAAIDAVSGFTNNTASGNGGNYIRIVAATVVSNLAIGAQSPINGAIVMSTNLTVQPSGNLTVGQGVVFKFDAAYEVIVSGSLNLAGTAFEPVVFTAIADDAFAGDTNNDGLSAGSPGFWRGVNYQASAAASKAENVVIRYPGAYGLTGFTSADSSLSARSIRVEKGFARGIGLVALAGDALNLVAWGCNGEGMYLAGGSFGLVHATSAANGIGIKADPAWSGTVVNSISWSNGTNFSNFGAGGQVFNSDGGFAGTNGNIDLPPQFVDLSTGDLRLQAGSPCIDSANPVQAVAVQKDHEENSRILDSNLSGLPGADMGAYERAVWRMGAAGVPKVGTTVTFTVTGPAGASYYVIGALDGVYPLSPYGILLAGAVPFVTVNLLVPIQVPVGTSLPIALPGDPGLVGLTAGIQTLTFPTGNPAVGNFGQLWRATVRP